MRETILVGIDDGAGAERAVEQATAIARQSGATVHLLTVVDTTTCGEPALGSAELHVDRLEDEAHDRLAALADRVETAGVEVVTHCKHGRPHRTLVEVAADLDADLVVVGFNTAGDWTRRGSTVERVIRGTDRPVLTA